MSYTCTLFSNTGFNAVNIPDTPALLAQVGSPVSVPSLDIVQERFLESVRVHANWNAVKNCDYVEVGGFYYIVNDVKMLNGDTAQLSLIPDFITSAGGPGALTVVDGITERVRVTGDSYGEYSEPDELMTPCEPLKMDIQRYSPSSSGYSFTEATIDLKTTGDSSYDNAKTYTDPVSGESVTVPENAPLSGVTSFTIAGTSHSNRTGVFNENDPDVVSGVQKCRALGTESSVISQYKVPGDYIGSASISSGMYSSISGVDLETSSNLLYRYGSYTPKNLKVLYSDVTKFGILTMNGDRIEFSPADIYDGGTGPTLRVLSDPRADGKPYFRFKSYLGDTSLPGFFTNCVGGAQWEQIPLVYTDKSGNALSRLQFEADAKLKYQEVSRDIFSTILGNAASSGASGMHGGIVSGAIAAGIGAITGALQSFNRVEEYQRQAQRELLQYAINNEIVAPQITFPFNANMLRDTLGNGAVLYRLEYTDTDMQRIDKLLTMYGYKHRRALEVSDFSGGTYFNYVKAQGVEVTALPRWWSEGISEQLRAGVRVWHTAPSPTYYSMAN